MTLQTRNGASIVIAAYSNVYKISVCSCRPKNVDTGARQKCKVLMSNVLSLTFRYVSRCHRPQSVVSAGIAKIGRPHAA